MNIKANVSPEANVEFLRELQITDPQRFTRLAKVDPSARQSMPTDASWAVGTCSECGRSIANAPFIERDEEVGEGREYCSRACRDGKVLRIHAPLLARKHATIQGRQAARKEQERARQANLRLEKAA
jgi:hypothetical protein